MLENGHRWVVELLDPAGGLAESFPLGDAIDWEPAEECVRWAAVRSGRYSPDEAWAAAATVKPIPSAQLGEPYTAGFELSLGANGNGSFSRAFPLAYFGGLAEECAASWVQSGRLASGDRFRYLVTAFAQDERPVPAVKTRASIRTLPPTLTIHEPETGSPPGEEQQAGAVDAADPPAFVPGAVLRETAEHALSSPEQEAGGFLLGRLERHPDSRDVATVVTGYLPARAEGTATRLSFTPECWTAAHSAIALRGNGEALVGWVHSHLVDTLCRDCPEERRRNCPRASGFFSEHDRSVHRVAFPRAYQIALVVNVSFGETTHSCFGWRDGAIARRGLHLDREPEERRCPERE